MYQISCRSRTRGRGLNPVKPVAGTPDPAKSGLDRWTIFIHGFNNSVKSAAATWRLTSEKLLDHRADLRAMILFYWPGDYSHWEIVSAMNYPRTIPIAKETAERLVTYIQTVTEDRNKTLHLSFVAHSLGSLVVLETIKLLRIAGAKVAISDVLLMAAAVPEGYCVSDEEYGQPFSGETREVVLYSQDDSVLKNFFKLGQRIAALLPPNRQSAVGWSGGPGAGPGRRWYANVRMDDFGHGDYWKKPESITEIAAVLTGGTSNRSPISYFGLRRDNLDSMQRDMLSRGEHAEDDYIPPDVIAGWLQRPLGP